MNAAILYASTHGRTRRAVAEAVQHLRLKADVFNVAETAPSAVADYPLLLVFCPTYGDEELQDDMEDFLANFHLDLSGRFFAICELGSYYGYDDFSFGAMRIIRKKLLDLGGRELCEPLSLDSFPRTNWIHLLDWVDYLNARINEQFRHETAA